VICCRGVSRVKELLPPSRALISRKRFAPVKALAPKSSDTVKIPLLTETLVTVWVDPTCPPLLALSNSANSKS
jgi:hypothetical protein